ncbi:MAG: glycosyltransferase [Saprospiraceae bacterium]
MKKILVLCINYEKSVFPEATVSDNRFYTYGFGAGAGKNLKAYLKEYDVEVWRLDNKVRRYYEENINGILYKVFPSIQIKGFTDFSFKFLRELKKEVKKTNPVLFVTFNHYGLLYQVAMFFSKSPIITTHHGGGPPSFDFKYYRNPVYKLRAALKWLIEKVCYKNVDMVLVGETKEAEYLKENVPSIECVPWSWGLNIEHFNSAPISRNEAKKLLGWDENKKYILYVGKLYKYKEVDRLVETWKKIKRERPEIELVLTGNEPKGYWGEEYYDMAEKAGAIIIGRVLNTELYKYYSASDVYVMFALRDDYYGGTGIAPLESLACNTPVVSYALRNYIGDNVNEIGEMPDTEEGYKKAILKVIDYPQKYLGMRESVEKFYSTTNTFANLKPYLEKLFNEHRI